MEDLLKNYMNFKAEIKSKEYEIKKNELEEVCVSSSNFTVNGDIRPKGYMESTVENKLISKTDKIIKLKKEIDALNLKIDMIDSLINTLSDYHRQIIDLKFKYNKNDSQIAVIMKREERTIRYATEKILAILEKKYANFLKIS